MNNILEVKNINKSFEDKEILKDFNLQVKKGEMTIIKGTSGRGKSTLLNIIGLLEKPNSGEIWINGKNTKNKENKFLKDEIGFIFQNYALVDNETVEYNLNIALKYVKGNKIEKKAQMEEVLNIVGLENYLNRKIYSLSGGEQQRVAIARVILKPASIILADEPTGSLDKDNAKKIFNLLREINDNGKTVIMVSHDNELVNLADKIIEL